MLNLVNVINQYFSLQPVRDALTVSAYVMGERIEMLNFIFKFNFTRDCQTQFIWVILAYNNINDHIMNKTLF